jgi:hypothetical protein
MHYIWCSKEKLAEFVFSRCPYKNKRIFVSANMIQVDGLNKKGDRVVRSMVLTPKGGIIDGGVQKLPDAD